MKWWLLLMVLGTARADCGICFRGKCLTPSELSINGTLITARTSAMDYNSNILYIIKDFNVLQAVQLDDNKVETIVTNQENIAYVRVDQVTGEVYYAYVNGAVLNKYKPKSGETEVITQRTSNHVWVNNETVYWAGLIKGLSYMTGSSSKKTVDHLKNNKVRSLVFDKSGNMYVVILNKVYKVKPDEGKTVVTASPYGLRVDGKGDIFLLDSKKYLIYQLNTNDQLNMVGALDAKYSSYFKTLVFDKYNNVLARSEGSKTFKYFKDTAEKCTIQDAENTPYIQHVPDSSKAQITTPKNVVDDSHFGD